MEVGVETIVGADTDIQGVVGGLKRVCVDAVDVFEPEGGLSGPEVRFGCRRGRAWERP